MATLIYNVAQHISKLYCSLWIAGQYSGSSCIGRYAFFFKAKNYSMASVRGAIPLLITVYTSGEQPWQADTDKI